MKKDAKTFEEVAERCTKFCPCEKCECKNSSKQSTSAKSDTSNCGSHASNSTAGNVSCKNCAHYVPDKVCDLDLYKEIVENHHL